LNPSTEQHLDETIKWTKFLSIAGFVMLAIMVAFPFVFMTLNLPDDFDGFSGIHFLPMLLLVLIYFFPIYYLFKFSAEARAALRLKDEAFLNNAMKFLKMHYRFMGILLIIVLAIYALVFAAFILGLIAGSVFA
jgi:hypothetical protein